MREPRRLIDDPEVHASIRDAIAGERKVRGESLLDLEGGWKKLQAAALVSASAAAIPHPVDGVAPSADTPARTRVDAPEAAKVANQANASKTGKGSVRWLHVGIGLSAMIGAGLVANATFLPATGSPHLVLTRGSLSRSSSELASRAERAIRSAKDASVAPGLESSASSSESPPSAETPSIVVSELPAAGTPSASTRSAASSSPRVRGATRAGAHEGTEASDDQDDVREELAQMARIRALVEQAPADALALVAEGQRKFARGHLVEEREGLAVIALARLGRRDEARRKAEAFGARYPKSALFGRIRNELGASSRED